MADDWTVGRAVNELTALFAGAGLDTPRLDARLLVGHALALEPSLLFARTDRVLRPHEAETVRALSARRLAHEPVSRIVGRREFWGLDFTLDGSTLDPRPDTETIVSAALALKHRLPPAPRILDLGTGSGCILVAILSEWPDATGLGIDRAPAAVACARMNADRLGVGARAAFREGDWCEGVTDSFDVIVSNPPYIARAEAASLAPEVAAFDPPLALFGGEDGLAAYRALIPAAGPRLRPGGRLVLEIGAGQEEAVRALLAAAGFACESAGPDLAGIVRALVARAA